jgi:AmmeMemoRadiSam system protein B
VIRPPSCAGSVYPDDPQELRAALDGWLALGRAAQPAMVPPRLVVSPHIDYPRGARAYAAAARAFATCRADVFVLFGTAHEGPARLFTVTRRDYATPLGVVETDRAAVAAVVHALGEAEALGSEPLHDGEHSVELPLLVLQHVVHRPFTAVPVLCASLSHLADPARSAAPFLTALATALRGRSACFVAGADLAHVGPCYGDARPPTAAEAARVEADDRRTLAFLERGDADGFRRDAVRDDARRRLCGTAPIWAAMRAAGGGARVLHYGRWTDGVDSVSFAAAAG